MFRGFFGIGAIFQIIALVHFVRRRPNGYWLWIIFIGGGIGAIAYLIAEALPDFGAMRHSMQGFSRRKRIGLLEAMVLENPSAGNFEELGDLLVDERKWARAKEKFDQALSARTDSIDPFFKRGWCQFELAQYAGAVSDLQHVVKHDPKYAYSRGLSMLAQSLAKLGRTEEAAAAFDKLFAQSTSSEALAVTAEFYLEQGRVEEARQVAKTLIARRATMPAFQRSRDRKWLRRAAKVMRASSQKTSTAAAPPGRGTATGESSSPQDRALGR
jgi:hypothetical protein